jgi:hypothetical protein
MDYLHEPHATTISTD